MALTLQTLPQPFTVCQIDHAAHVDWRAPFCFLSQTDQELSLVCPTEYAPAEALVREDGWRALRVTGKMAFSIVGVLSQLTGCLAARGIPVFAISTYDTDYLLVKADTWQAALTALEDEGHALES